MDEVEFLLEENVKLSVFLDKHRSPTISPVEINESLVLQPTFLPSRILDSKSEQSKETDFPCIVYNFKGNRGIAPVYKRRIRIGDCTLVVGDLYPLNSMVSTRTVKDYLEGREVDGKELYERTFRHSKDNVDLEVDIYYHIGTLYEVGTHFHPAYQTYPYLHPRGPPICGKTRANYTFSSCAFHPQLSPDISDASFYYLREAMHCCVSLDERNLRRKDETKLIDLLNSGYKRGGQVLRMFKNPSSGTMTPRLFSVYGPFIYSGAYTLPYMTATRTLIIPMRKTLDKKYSDRDDPLPEKPGETELREQWYIFRLTHGSEAFKMYQSLKASDFNLSNRVWELAHPLIATALLIDEDIVKNVLEFFKEQEEESVEFRERDEGKVLSVLAELVEQTGWTDDYRNVKDIKELVVEQFEEDSKEWRSQRVTNALRLLHFTDIKVSHGYTKVRIFKDRVQDWARRLGLQSQIYSPDPTLCVSSLPEGRVGVLRVESGENISLQKEEERGREGRDKEKTSSLSSFLVSTQSIQLDSNEKRQAILKAIRDLERNIGYAHKANLAYGFRDTIPEAELKSLLALMQRDGLISEAKPDCFKVTRS